MFIGMDKPNNETVGNLDSGDVWGTLQVMRLRNLNQFRPVQEHIPRCDEVATTRERDAMDLNVLKHTMFNHLVWVSLGC